MTYKDLWKAANQKPAEVLLMNKRWIDSRHTPTRLKHHIIGEKDEMQTRMFVENKWSRRRMQQSHVER